MITVTKKRNGRYYIGLDKLEAEELRRTCRKMHCSDDPGAFAARFRVAKSLDKLAVMLREKPVTP